MWRQPSYARNMYLKLLRWLYSLVSIDVMGIFKICKIPLINCDQSNQHQGHFIQSHF